MRPQVNRKGRKLCSQKKEKYPVSQKAEENTKKKPNPTKKAEEKKDNQAGRKYSRGGKAKRKTSQAPEVQGD